MQLREITKGLNSMQMSAVKMSKSQELIYMRSSITEYQHKLFTTLKLTPPRDVNPQETINQYFM
jgi:hypothetical protein